MAQTKYSWQDVMLGVDIQQEAKREQREIEAIQEKQKKEGDAASMWSLGLSVIGGAIFGPEGYFLGKQIGTYGADLAYDWEGMEVSEGKFYEDERRKFNKSIEEAASDQTTGQMVNTVLDLGSMYVQAGGLEEGFGADFTTFGAGDAEWSVFGKNRGLVPVTGEPSMQLVPGPQGPVLSELTPVTFEEDIVSSLWSGLKGPAKTSATSLGGSFIDELTGIGS